MELACAALTRVENGPYYPGEVPEADDSASGGNLGASLEEPPSSRRFLIPAVAR